MKKRPTALRVGTCLELNSPGYGPVRDARAAPDRSVYDAEAKLDARNAVRAEARDAELDAWAKEQAASGAAD